MQLKVSHARPESAMTSRSETRQLMPGVRPATQVACRTKFWSARSATPPSGTMSVNVPCSDFALNQSAARGGAVG
jgi:hypothetical protein